MSGYANFFACDIEPPIQAITPAETTHCDSSPTTELAQLHKCRCQCPAVNLHANQFETRNFSVFGCLPCVGALFCPKLVPSPGVIPSALRSFSSCTMPCLLGNCIVGSFYRPSHCSGEVRTLEIRPCVCSSVQQQSVTDSCHAEVCTSGDHVEILVQCGVTAT